MRDPVPITTALDSMMSSLRGTDRVQIGGVFGRWDDAVGPNVAAHVRPIRLDQRVLTVEVEEAVWATQVTFLATTIITRLFEVARVEVDRVEVRVARSAGATRRPQRSP
jgi:predicted nucleic acid-binding Zn ribbon protein